MKSKLYIAALVIIGFSTVGCTSKIVSTEQYSGFLSDYSQLQETKTATGKEVMRWVAPGFYLSNYSGIYYNPIIYYPSAHPTARVNQATLDTTLAYANQQVMTSLSARLPLVKDSDAPRTLIFKGAITSVSAETEGMKPYDVIPIAAVLAGAMAATGERDQDTILYFEGEFIDAATGRTVLKSVRKGFGKSVPNSDSPITFEDLQSAIDAMVADITLFKQ